MYFKLLGLFTLLSGNCIWLLILDILGRNKLWADNLKIIDTDLIDHQLLKFCKEMDVNKVRFYINIFDKICSFYIPLKWNFLGLSCTFLNYFRLLLFFKKCVHYNRLLNITWLLFTFSLLWKYYFFGRYIWSKI
ncbi:MAG: Uncharacterised protein [Flavobacteriaceae bacterium]|nr:MAG: Uncharacterised protein [Flavobacteriaceae bacterium]